MSHETLTRYCNIDYDREIAIVAEVQKDKKRIIGVARLISEPDRKSGEYAIVVGDQWQGIGVGSKLLDYIIEIGKDMSLKTIVGYVILSNSAMLHMCTRRGFVMEPLDEETMKATLTLP